MTVYPFHSRKGRLSRIPSDAKKDWQSRCFIGSHADCRFGIFRKTGCKCQCPCHKWAIIFNAIRLQEKYRYPLRERIEFRADGKLHHNTTFGYPIVQCEWRGLTQ